MQQLELSIPKEGVSGALELETENSRESAIERACDISGNILANQEELRAFCEWFVPKHPNIPVKSAVVVLKLVAEGGTVPFIARYRKDATGNLDEVCVAKVIEASETWSALVKRKIYVLKEIKEQGKLTDELRIAIEQCGELDRLEDYYLPYKRKRKTKATLAREAGLEPLADWIWQVGHGIKADESLSEVASRYVATVNTSGVDESEPKNRVDDVQQAIDGARHILIERLAENVNLRQYVREQLFNYGGIVSSLGEKPDTEGKYEQYREYEESIGSLMKPSSSHRYLALRRGEAEKILLLKVGAISPDSELEQRLMDRFQQEAISDHLCHEDISEVLLKAARFALKLHVLPSIEAEVHRSLKEAADEVAIGVFSDNVKKVLLAAPLGSRMVLGVDPGIRTGCKLALVDVSGKFIANSVIHIDRPQERIQCVELLKKIGKNGDLKAIAVGNGTGSRETERFFREVVAEASISAHVVSVNEAGASVYSASEVARAEFPELDITVRGAISIARRLQDPLAELVKIDPKSIGVGQYQHDVSQVGLKKSLQRVVESCVNSVGVNLNTASEYLLAYVAGVGTALAKNIVKVRETKGMFVSKESLLEVPRFSQKVFEQAAGFIRVPESGNPLDNTGVHPEAYGVLMEYAKSQSVDINDFIGAGATKLRNVGFLKERLGELALKDIVDELEKPGRDPRDNFVPFSFMEGVEEVKDLKIGMRCPGIITNVTNFGAFVDIGVHQDGLVHISQLSDSFVKDPQAICSPGDKVSVVVTEVDVDRKRIALSMRSDALQNLNASSTGVRDQSKASDSSLKAKVSNNKTNVSPKDVRGQRNKNESSGKNKSEHNSSDRGARGNNKDSFSNTPFAALKGLSIKTDR